MSDEAGSVTEQTASLLWEACRRDPDPAGVRRALAGGADPAWAVRAASDQRIGALLWRALDAAGSLDALGPDRATLGDMADAFRMQAVLLLPRAVALAVRPLTDVGLEPVVFKGPAVAARYPEPGLRPMDDIDLLLPRADHQRALDALGRAGWQVTRPGAGNHYDTVLSHPEIPSYLLEVHYGLEGASERPTALDSDRLWARRQPLECAGTNAFGLPPVEEIVVLAVHAGKPHHRFVRLVWMADLAMIAGHAEEHDIAIEWDRVLDVARAARCVPVVGAALAMARRAGLDAPVGLFPLPSRGHRGDTVRRLLSVTWPLRQRDLTDYQFNYALTDGRARRARMLLRHLVLGHGLRDRARRVAGLPPRAPSRLE
jgi:putative nucleotidyltransferase-like protein